MMMGQMAVGEVRSGGDSGAGLASPSSGSCHPPHSCVVSVVGSTALTFAGNKTSSFAGRTQCNYVSRCMCQTLCLHHLPVHMHVYLPTWGSHCLHYITLPWGPPSCPAGCGPLSRRAPCQPGRRCAPAPPECQGGVRPGGGAVRGAGAAERCAGEGVAPAGHLLCVRLSQRCQRPLQLHSHLMSLGQWCPQSS